jgi:Domain of unknown function (DUF4397)
MTKLKTLGLLLSAAMLASCGTSTIQDITGPLGGARIRFFNFGINAPSVNFYANGAKMSATSSTTGVEAVTGVSYGSVSAGGNYSTITAGSYALTGKIAATVDKDLVVSSLTGAIADGKLYSFYISGFYDAVAKTAEGFLVEDAMPATFDYTQAYVRFVNASPNSSPMNLFAKNTTTTTEVPVGGLVAYKAGGAFTAIPAAVYDLSTRVSGSSTNAIARTAVSFVAGKYYTITARGDMTIVSTTLTNRPFLDNTANR